MDVIIVGVISFLIGYTTAFAITKTKALKLIRELYEDNVISKDVLIILRSYITIRLR